MFVGIYYSNPFLNSDKSLEKMEKRLNWYIARAKLTNKEKQEIKAYSFIDGFKKKTFQVLPLKNKIYKNHNREIRDIQNENNNGILQFGITEIDFNLERMTKKVGHIIDYKKERVATFRYIAI